MSFAGKSPSTSNLTSLYGMIAAWNTGQAVGRMSMYDIGQIPRASVWAIYGFRRLGKLRP